MTVQVTTIQETVQEDQNNFQQIMSDSQLADLFNKHGVQDERKRKLFVRCFFWLMVFSAAEPSRRGSMLTLIGFFLGAIALLYPEEKVDSLSKNAVSKRLKNVTWYLFRGVYNHLLKRYTKLLDSEDKKFLGRFRDAFAIDGSVISLVKTIEKVFESVHKNKASLKLNVKFSLKVAAVSKLQVTSGKQHDSRFRFVTQTANCLYLIDLGYWSFSLMKKIIDAGSFFVMRLKGNCDPLIVKVSCSNAQHLVGKRLSEIGDFLTAQVAQGFIDLTVQLSRAKKPRFKDDVRLVGLFHEGQWRFYVTNIVETNFTPQVIYELYAQRWQVEIVFTQMTKEGIFTVRVGGNYIADFDLAIVNNNSVNEQFNQLAALSKVKRIQGWLNFPAKVLDVLSQLEQVELLLGLRLQLAQLLGQAAVRLG